MSRGLCRSAPTPPINQKLRSNDLTPAALTRAQNAFAAAKANLAGANTAVVQAKENRNTVLSGREANAVLIANSTETSNPAVALARSSRDQAAIDLGRTVLRAPVDGVVAERQVRLGQRVQTSSPLLSVVPVQDMQLDQVRSYGSARSLLERGGMAAAATNEVIDYLATSQSIMLSANQIMAAIGLFLLFAAALIWLARKPARPPALWRRAPADTDTNPLSMK